MLLTPEKSLCKPNQAIVVSRDKYNSRTHRAINTGGVHCIRHYKLDGDIIKQQKCCDFLLINDTVFNAYFIELKGSNIDEAVDQLENAVSLCKDELPNYNFLYRIIASRVSTHKISSNKFRKFQAKCGTKLITKENILEEKIC